MLKNLFFVFLILASAAAQSSTDSTTVASTTTGPTTTPGTTVSGETTSPGATTTAGTGTTTAACSDDPNTNCSQYASLCSNAKYQPLLQQFCPKTCGFCGGGSTAGPIACVDSSTNCANWSKNGFCDSTFYTCQQKKDYCAKTCNLCTKTC